MRTEPMRTPAAIRKARWVACTLLLSGLIFGLVGTFTGSHYAASPAFMLGFAGGIWLGRAEEAHARMVRHQHAS